MSPLAFLIATIVCAVPFYFAGVVTSATITKFKLPMGGLYASDLLGASLGCLFVLGGLELFDAPSLILLCGAFGVLAAISFGSKSVSSSFRRGLLLLFAAFGLLPFANAFSLRGIRPIVIKGDVQDIEDYLIEKWNSFSRVIVYKGKLQIPAYWGPSPKAPREKLFQFKMNIDGEAGTFMWRFEKLEDIEPLRYDVTNVGYFMDRPGKACVIGVGGGRDVQSAILFGHNDVLGIEVNPIFIGLLDNAFREFTGLAGRNGVRLVVDDARSYLSRSTEKFSVIQMSLTDTWASTGAGAFSLTENALYTVEAWQVFLNRLADNGFFTISRWHNPRNIGETGRVISLAVASLLKLGVENPADHLVLVTTANISTLLVSRQPFREVDLATLRSVCEDLQYSMPFQPGQLPDEPMLRRILLSRSMQDLLAATSGGDLNYEPPTDESPYFFNMLRLRGLAGALNNRAGVLQGNLAATFTLFLLLVSLCIVAIITIVVPLALRKKYDVATHPPRGPFVSGAVYFCLIGAAFMFLEIALIQRLSVFLGHPVYALGILLFTLIASTGMGSFLSDRLPLRRLPLIVLFPLVTAAAAIGARFVLSAVLAHMITVPILHRIVASIVVVFPLGVLMGFFFPTGMTLAKKFDLGDTPWFWALNGIFGVLCSVFAVFISIFAGISTNFYIAGACYAIAAVFLVGMRKAPVQAERNYW